MRFTITTVVAIMATLAPSSTAFRIQTYSDTGCGSPLQNVNIYDNTCGSWPDAFKSFKFLSWGAGHQCGYFLASDCSLGTSLRKGWVDPTTNNFAKDTCYSFVDGRSANGVASYDGGC
ncbi:hypothetical protein K491DRAFT_665433 [Lophiostoma macrostomum CBS 122681]|uniref:Uncharacterized protein n=1 Tax=Lophiostoma macrostomum CBS 122681 TaxID=1314788 RepID=A0A6A6SWZ8_9PLEO|nr:hypothetical protein K491DRAFT_665433 [Lophiostoma macrostomum CBS 122681]